jgi:hypothetical protein
MAESKNGNVRFTNIGQSADQLESFGWTISPLYAAPFQFQPLTEEAVLECWKQVYEPGRREHDNATRMARAIEAKLKEKNDAAQPAVPDALNPKDENPAYASGWNDCRAEMLKGMK